MKFSDETVEKVKHRLMEADMGEGANFLGMAQAALASLTLQDLMQVFDDAKRVKTALEAAKLFVLKHPDDLMALPVVRVIDEAYSLLVAALAPFVEASNG